MKDNISSYLSQTQKAVEQLFDSIDFYNQILKSVRNPVFITDISFINEKEKWEKEYNYWHDQNTHNFERRREAINEYRGYVISKGVLAGSIFQIATTAIELFSKNEEIPKSVSDVVKKDSKAVKFCIGREVESIPIGLILLAGRNQYSHWTDEKPRKQTIDIFKKIARRYGDFDDPAFDLSNNEIYTYSHNIISLIDWHSYEQFSRDLTEMLST